MLVESPTFPKRTFTTLRSLSFVTALLILSGCAQDAPEEASEPATDESSSAVVASPAGAPSTEAVDGPRLGKYGCAESISRMVNGSFEYSSEGRGFITLKAAGRYVDPFGVEGSYRHEQATQETRFTGGALDNAVAMPLEDDGSRVRVVIPTQSGERRWSCSLI